jgi:hypothetical protein
MHQNCQIYRALVSQFFSFPTLVFAYNFMVRLKTSLYSSSKALPRIEKYHGVVELELYVSDTVNFFVYKPCDQEI